MVENLSDEQIRGMQRGGHDPEKVFAAYRAAVEHTGSPTVILAQTIKGTAWASRRGQEHHPSAEEAQRARSCGSFGTDSRSRFPDEELAEVPFYRPPEESREVAYLMERREALGGFSPPGPSFTPRRFRPPASVYSPNSWRVSGDREVATTMALVHLLAKLLKDPTCGKLVVPIVAEEARTFGMESLFRQDGIYSPPASSTSPWTGSPPLLQGGEGRTDPGGGHPRGRCHVLLGRRGHGLHHPRPPHGPLLHLLLHVRVPAHRRPHLGRGGRARRGFLLGGTAAGRRWPARDSSTRTVTATSSRSPSQPAAPTTPPTPTSWRSS